MAALTFSNAGARLAHSGGLPVSAQQADGKDGVLRGTHPPRDPSQGNSTTAGRITRSSG